MADHEINSDNVEEEPPANLLTMPQELLDQILTAVLKQDNNRIVYLTQPGGTRDSGVKRRYVGLARTCRKLQQDATKVFFEKNRFEICPHEDAPKLSDEQSRLIKKLDFQVLALFEQEREDEEGEEIEDEMWARMEVRVGSKGYAADTIVLTVCGKTWTISQDGTKQGHPISEEDDFTDDVFIRLRPSMKILYDTLQIGHGIDVKTLKDVIEKMDAASCASQSRIDNRVVEVPNFDRAR